MMHVVQGGCHDLVLLIAHTDGVVSIPGKHCCCKGDYCNKAASSRILLSLIVVAMFATLI